MARIAYSPGSTRNSIGPVALLTDTGGLDVLMHQDDMDKLLSSRDADIDVERAIKINGLRNASPRGSVTEYDVDVALRR